MVDFWQIQIINETAIVDIGKKLQLLAKDLSFKEEESVKLALAASEFSRAVYENGKQASITASLFRGNPDVYLVLSYDGIKGSVTVDGIKKYFDDIKSYAQDDHTLTVELLKLIPNPASDLEETFIKQARERLQKLTREQLLKALKQEMDRRRRSEEETRKINMEFEHRVHERTKELKKSEDEIRRINKGLEKRVADRTKQLNETAEKLKQVNEELKKLAIIDPLTELLNRRGLQQALSRELQVYKREQEDFLSLLIDLDEFKKINDTFGHAVGDVVLKEIARNLRSSLRSTDYLARIGGDEFMILLPKTRLAEGIKVSEKLRLAISGKPIILSSDQNLKVTGSIGVIPVTIDTPSIDELLGRTHQVMKRSKQGGKNKVSYETYTSHSSDDSDVDFVNVKKQFVDESRYYVVKQSIIDLSNRLEIGYELLTRSRITGFEMPQDFFRVSFEENILTIVDHMCLKKAVEASVNFAEGLRCHINLLPSTLIGIPPEHLIAEFPIGKTSKTYCIEISEQHIIGNPSYLLGSVDALREAGVLISIDDVGFGHSCLESLIVLEPDVIKIDKTSVIGVSRNEAQIRSLMRLLNMVDGLGVKMVIAEGVETEDDLNVLKDLGVKYVQGYLFGKPA